MTVTFIDKGKCIECGCETNNKMPMTYLDYDLPGNSDEDHEVEVMEFYCDECVDREHEEIKREKLKNMLMDSIELDIWL